MLNCRSTSLCKQDEILQSLEIFCVNLIMFSLLKTITLLLYTPLQRSENLSQLFGKLRGGKLSCV